MSEMMRYQEKSSVVPRRFLGCLVIVSVLASTLAACTPHTGGDTLAFLRAGQLWTINSDGSGAQTIADGNIVSSAWSPDHHQIVFRSSQQAYKRAAALPVGSTWAAPDAPGNLFVISLDGGAALQITPDAAGVARSDAWWEQENRLLYREGAVEAADAKAPPTYFVSQADQPGGIARKALVEDASLPALSPDGTRVAFIDSAGAVRVGTPGTPGTVVATDALITLPGTNRPAHLLWQPRHDALLYASSAAGVTLLLRNLNGGTQTIGAVPALLDAAFSPDGSLLLVRTPATFELWDITSGGKPLFTWPGADPLALPWWSPNGQALLIEDTSGWQLVNVATRAISRLLTMTMPGAPQATTPQTTWHPTGASPWSPDGSHFVFVSAGGNLWQGKPLPKGSTTGLYIAAVATGQATGAPTLIDSGADRSPEWSYLDPSTTFLMAS